MKQIVFVFSLILLFSFASPAQAGADEYTSGPRPAWVTNPPPADKEFMYFTGMGTSKKNELAEAEQFAIQDIIASITRYIGVEVTSRTSAEAKGTLDSFTAGISREVIEKGSSRLSGFRVVEKWFVQDQNGLQLHILVQYETEAILREKTRIAELFRGRVEAITIPESQGQAAESAGNYYEALLRYVDAAAAASTSTLSNANIYFSRNMDAAARMLERITLVKVSGDIRGVAGEVLAESFTLKVLSGAGASAKGLGGVEITAAYREYRNGTASVKTQVIKSDSQGAVSFKHPLPTFVGQEKVVMSVDISASIKKIQATTREQTDRLASLQRLALARKLEWTLTVVSKAHDLPTAVFFVDLDENGRPLASQSTAGGINEVLTREGFVLQTSPISPAVFLGKKDSESIAIIKRGMPEVARVVIGTASVESSQSDSGRYLLRVRGTVKVLDIATGALLYEKTGTRSITGTSLESARSTALGQLGRDLGQKVAAEAP